MKITESQLFRAVPETNWARAKEFVAVFNEWADRFGVNTPKRVVHFLAQVFHESGALRYTEELASGAAYDTGAKAQALGNTPEKDGDGQRYKGRGFIQITGRANYAAYEKSGFCDGKVTEHPESLAQSPGHTKASLWFWWSRKLNDMADADDGGTAGLEVVKRITKRVNGGLNGLSSRLFFYRRFKKEFGLMVAAMMVMASCTSTLYVPVETVRTEVQNRTDTILQIDTVEREKTVTIIEADSELLAKYGILLRQNRNAQNAYLVLQKEIEREKSKKQEVHTDTVVRTEIVEVPVPVERKLSKWEQFCLDYGKVTTGGTVVCLFLIIAYLVRRFKRPRE